MAAKKVTTSKAATTKTPATKKPAQQVKKVTTAKKSVTKKPVEEEVVEEKKGLGLKEKILIVAGALAAGIGAIAIHGHSKYNEGAADQANIDFDKMSKTPTEVTVNLLPGEGVNVVAIEDDASASDELAEDQIEEI